MKTTFRERFVLEETRSFTWEVVAYQVDSGVGPLQRGFSPQEMRKAEDRQKDLREKLSAALEQSGTESLKAGGGGGGEEGGGGGVS